MRTLPLRRSWMTLAALAAGVALTVPAVGLVSDRLGAPVSQGSPDAPALAVAVLSVRTSDGYDRRRVFTGRVEADRVSELGFERSGLLAEVHAAEGDAVRAGEVVARLDAALLEARRRELAASLAAAEADLALADATLARYRHSVGQGAVTRQALDEAREGARAAAAGLDLARARIASVELDLAKSELRAPFDGVVVRRAVDEGRVVAAGEPVVVLQEQGVPEVRVGVAGLLVDVLVPGDAYELVWRGRTLTARLRSLLPVRGAGTRTRDALFVPFDAPRGLHPGELVELRLSERVAEPGLWLPVSALSEGTRGLWQAYLAKPLEGGREEGLAADHWIRPRPVEVLYHDGDRVYVRGPLGDGDRVVALGTHRVVPGQPVRVVESGPGPLAMEGR